MRRFLIALIAATALAAPAAAQMRMGGAIEGFGPAAPKVGETAPDFEALDAAGETARLYTQRGKWVVLEFVLEGDRFGESKQASMRALREKYPDDKVAFWTVVGEGEAGDTGRVKAPERPQREEMMSAVEATQDLAVEWQEKAGDGATVLTDGPLAVARRSYGAMANMTYLIDPEGRVAERWTWNNPEELERTLDTRLGIAGPRVASNPRTVAPETATRDRRRQAETYRKAAPALRELREKGAAGFLKARDANGDGALTAEEAGLPGPAFTRVDPDKDGRIGEEELARLRQFAEENQDAIEKAIQDGQANAAKRPKKKAK